MSKGKLQIFNFKNLLLGISKVCNIPEVEILKAIQLSESDLKDNNDYIDADYGIALWNFGLAQKDYIGLEVAKINNPLVGGPLLILLISQYPDFELAAIKLCEQSNFMGNTIKWEYDKGAVTFDAVWKEEHPQIFRSAIEMNIVTVFQMAQQISHGKLVAERIEVSYSDKTRHYHHLSDLEAKYTKAFESENYKCTVRFGQKRNAVVFKLADLKMKNPFCANREDANETEGKLKKQIENSFTEKGIADRCRETIKNILYSNGAGKLSCNLVAEGLNILVHKLRKELTAVNTTYLIILDEARIEIYNSLKENEQEKLIASKLGFKGKSSKTTLAHWKKKYKDKLK